jgi:hypothetical protein
MGKRTVNNVVDLQAIKNGVAAGRVGNLTADLDAAIEASLLEAPQLTRDEVLEALALVLGSYIHRNYDESDRENATMRAEDIFRHAVDVPIAAME